jgi:hypothetical protein
MKDESAAAEKDETGRVQMFIENRDGCSLHYERVLHESILWITFSTNGETGSESRGIGNSERKKKSTYFPKNTTMGFLRGYLCP